MDNTYAVRTKLKVPSRPVSKPALVRSDNVTLFSKITISKEPADIVHKALPTIPIMKDVLNNQSANMPLPKPHVNVVTPVSGKTTSDGIIRSAVPRKLLTELMIGEIEPEPATHSSSTKFTHKIVRHKRPLLKQFPLAVLLTVALGTTGYVSYNSWHTNNSARLANKGNSANTAVLGIANDTKSDGMPKAIYIDKIGVVSKVISIGINTDGTMQSPSTTSDVGWYANSAKPGQDGAMLFNGYADTETIPPSVFSYLGNLTKGDTIIVERGDGKKFNYKVAYIKVVPIEDVDMSDLLTPYENAVQGINLITYTDSLANDSSTPDHMTVVYAVASN